MGILNPTELAAAGGGLVPLPKTLVILGSSNGAGMGASTYTADPSSPTWASPSTSWAGLLTTALEAIDSSWSVINRSVSGSGTASSISRFYTDVAIHRPSHVLLCTHPLNDGLDFALCLKNTITLIGLCRSIGAMPIIRGAYTYNSYTAAQYRAALDFNRQLDRLGVARTDHMTLFDNGSGGLIGGTTFSLDGLHWTDAGQSGGYTSIDLGLFLNAITESIRSDRVAAAWRVKPGDTSGAGIRINSTTGLQANVRSFTMRARVKGDASLTTARAFLVAYIFGAVGSTPLRIRNPSSVYEMADTVGAVGSASAVNPTSDTTPHDLVVTFNHLTSTASFYIDGALSASGVVTSVANIAPEFYFGARGEGSPSSTTTAAAYANFSDMSIWQVPLSAVDIADLNRSGRRPGGSLILDAEISYSPPATASQGYLLNTVRNGIVPAIGEARWEAVTAF